jgi:hypothetical protein
MLRVVPMKYQIKGSHNAGETLTVLDLLCISLPLQELGLLLANRFPQIAQP